MEIFNGWQYVCLDVPFTLLEGTCNRIKRNCGWIKNKFFLTISDWSLHDQVARIGKVVKFPATCLCKWRSFWNIIIYIDKMGDYMLMIIYFQVRLLTYTQVVFFSYPSVTSSRGCTGTSVSLFFHEFLWSSPWPNVSPPPSKTAKVVPLAHMYTGCWELH